MGCSLQRDKHEVVGVEVARPSYPPHRFTALLILHFLHRGGRAIMYSNASWPLTSINLLMLLHTSVASDDRVTGVLARVLSRVRN